MTHGEIIEFALKFGSYIVAIVGFLWVMKSTIEKTAIKLEEHTESDSRMFAELGEKMDQTVELLRDHTQSLARHDERTAGLLPRLERVENKLDAVDDKLNNLRVDSARKP